MNKNYKLLSEGVRSRINPENIAFQKAFSDELATLSYNDVLAYIRIAMKGVEPEYTRRSRDAGDKVKEHLSGALQDVSYRYQGSVMTDTHIKGFSDIDLLAISTKFYSCDDSGIKLILESFEKRSSFSATSINRLQEEANVGTYVGNVLDILRNQRLASEKILLNTYTSCDVTNPRAIKVLNKSLGRKVDVVTASWYDDVASVINDKGDFRGVQVYNKDTHSKEQPDYPFLSIARINARGSETNGRLKKMIRFLKNTKEASSHSINLSSFDINAICYDIAVGEYHNLSFYQLVPVLYKQLKNICISTAHSDRIVSVDGREYIFRFDTLKLNQLRILLQEVEVVYLDLQKHSHLV